MGTRRAAAGVAAFGDDDTGDGATGDGAIGERLVAAGGEREGGAEPASERGSTGALRSVGTKRGDLLLPLPLDDGAAVSTSNTRPPASRRLASVALRLAARSSGLRLSSVSAANMEAGVSGVSIDRADEELRSPRRVWICCLISRSAASC